MKSPSLPRSSRADPWLACALTLLVGAVPATCIAQAAPAQESSRSERTERSSPPDGFVSEPHFLRRAIDFGARTAGDGNEVKTGFYPEMSNMVTGAGWISLGPGYRHWFGGDTAIVDASTAYSWRGYKMGQARVEFTKLRRSRLAIGSQVRWQDLTQVTFFGEGADTPDTDRSEYRMTSTDVVGYTTIRPKQWWSVSGRFGWLQSPTLGSTSGSFKRGNPETRDVFPDNIVFTFADQPSYLHTDLSIAVDTRDHRSHPTSGGLYRVAYANYSDRGAGVFSFDRYEAEAAQFLPVADDRIVFALHGWIVGTDTWDNKVIPFYLEPSLGGGNTLRAYTDYRFHDRNLMVINAETRVALFTHIDAAAFVDAGNVAARAADLDLAKRSYGIGLRLHSDRATFARVDVAHGTDGWRFVFRTSDPLHLTRLSRRTATIPFAP
jgi:surface antigen Omp85-like protein